jgi:hypothetical protein
MPRTIVWAWERPEDLRFINTQQVGVAYLAKSIYLRGSSVSIKPRMQPLELPSAAKLTAVVRIESDGTLPAELTGEQLTRTIEEIVELKRSNPVTIQIDFDATRSERAFYRELIGEVSRQISPVSLSITALASWCSGDRWLNDLPIAEAVPMLFRMGIDRNTFTSRLTRGDAVFDRPCDHAAGVSTDELIPSPKVERLYLFSPKPWTPDSLTKAMEDFKR